MGSLAALALLVAPALSQEAPADLQWKDQAIAPKHIPDFTAYTIPEGVWRLGFTGIDYGLLDNFQVGTQVAPYLLGIVNFRAKVTAIQTPKLDVSLDGSLYMLSLSGEDAEGQVRFIPLGWRASWLAHEQLGLHLGTAWYIGEASGQFPLTTLTDALIGALGVDMSGQLAALLGENDTEVYGGAQLSLTQLRLAADVRLNRRDTIILASNTYLSLRGRLDAGVELDDENLTAGVATTFVIPFQSEDGASLSEAVPTITTLSWQFSWEHLHLRAGIGVLQQDSDPAVKLWTFTQAWKLYWLV